MKKIDKKWFEYEKEIKRPICDATWIPLRVCKPNDNGKSGAEVGYVEDSFFCNAVAFPKVSIDEASKLGWGDIGICREPRPYAFGNGMYKRCDEYQWNDQETIGTNLVFVHRVSAADYEEWIINPDLIMALGLVKERDVWVRPEENYVEVIREVYSSETGGKSIYIRKEHLLDYLAARRLNLRLSSYGQRSVNYLYMERSPYTETTNKILQDSNGILVELRVSNLNDIYGGDMAVFKSWRTDFDEEQDAPIFEEETDENTDFETKKRELPAVSGIGVLGEVWRDEWLFENGVSERVRGDAPVDMPIFITGTDGVTETSNALNNENVGKWLYFSPVIISECLKCREFALKWYSSETGGLLSASGYNTHFGLNPADLIVVYAYDIAKLPKWEQQMWKKHNVTPEGGTGVELADAQVRSSPASSMASEVKFLKIVDEFENIFRKKYVVEIFNNVKTRESLQSKISRFSVASDEDLLTLAKNLHRYFMEAINTKSLKGLVPLASNDLKSIKLIEALLSKNIAPEHARKVTAAFVGVNELRQGDAHLTSSDLNSAYELLGIDRNLSLLRQAEMMIENYGASICLVLELLMKHK